MITKVSAKGFKGLDFDDELQALNVYIGPNGIGKSARSEALLLAVLGYIPGGPKKNEAILDAYGNEKLYVGVEVGGKSFTRRFMRSSSGKVSQTFTINKAKVSKEHFVGMLVESGNPKVLDLSTFTDASDQKKIDTIFSLFPPAGDVGALDETIDAAKEKLSGLQNNIGAAEKAMQRLARARAEIQLPSGTQAEISSQIESIQKSLEVAQKQLEEARIAKVKEDAEEKAKKEAQEQAQAQYKKNEEKVKELSDREKDIKAAEDRLKRRMPPKADTPSDGHNPAESIKAIIQAIQGVGCPVCAKGAGYMVAVRELRKYQ